MNLASPGVPGGFRDLLFEETRARRTVETRLAERFTQQGYRELSPPSVELLEIYSRGNQHVHQEAIKFLDRHDQLVALRADFTPAVARIVASRFSGLPGPFRIWYAGDVFRKADRHHAQFCEFGQIGAELIGLPGFEGDHEILALAIDLLDTVGLQQVQIHLNHARIFGGLLGELGLDARGVSAIRSEIGRKDTRGLARRLEELGVHEEVRRQVQALTMCIGGQDVLEEARGLLHNEGAREALDELARLSESLSGWSDRIVYDLTEVDEMEYYTGIMMTFFAPQLRTELGKGGRYDMLLGSFGLDSPAVGFSFSLDHLVELQ